MKPIRVMFNKDNLFYSCKVFISYLFVSKCSYSTVSRVINLTTLTGNFCPNLTARPIACSSIAFTCDCG